MKEANSPNLVTSSGKANFYLFLSVRRGRFGPRCPPKSYLRHLLAAATAVYALFSTSPSCFLSPAPGLRGTDIWPPGSPTQIHPHGAIYDHCAGGVKENEVEGSVFVV